MAEGSLSQEEIDMLLKGSSDGPEAGGIGDLASLLGDEDASAAGDVPAPEPAAGGAGGGGAGGGGKSAADELASLADMAGIDADFNEALGAALGPEPKATPRAAPSKSKPFGQDFGKQNLNLLLDVNMSLTVELGRTQMSIREINLLTEGSIVELDKNHGEPVDITVNGKLVARGIIVVVDEFYGVQIIEFIKSFSEMVSAMN